MTALEARKIAKDKGLQPWEQKNIEEIEDIIKKSSANGYYHSFLGGYNVTDKVKEHFINLGYEFEVKNNGNGNFYKIKW